MEIAKLHADNKVFKKVLKILKKKWQFERNIWETIHQNDFFRNKQSQNI